MSQNRPEQFSLVLAGEAGQGLQSIETMLSTLLIQAGFHLFTTKEYMSRVRGGTNSVQILVSTRPAPAPVDRIDLLLPLSAAALPHLAQRMDEHTLVIGDPETINHPGLISVPFRKLALQTGGVIMTNTLAAGLASALFGLGESAGDAFLDRNFARKSEETRNRNKEAFRSGYTAGLALEPLVRPKIPVNPHSPGGLMVTGNEAVALGALAGGVQYVVAYPMSPGTAVIELLAEYSKDFDVLVEQVEDEIGVVNMALGAWFAGARTLVTTSGGGFALMTEGVSLAGMAEIPLVVHLAQRPGPATGLPTRTLQGDLFLAAFAGHGDFPRLVLAPGSLEEAFRLSGASFELADRFQVPVFLLTDQYLLDSCRNVAPLDPRDALAWAEEVGKAGLAASQDLEARTALSQGRQGPVLHAGDAAALDTADGPAGATRHDGPLAGPGFPETRDGTSGSWILPSTPDYRRAVLTSDGISPRAIPGYGTGVVTADSDEHDETGHITENLQVRDDMVRKRKAKLELLRQAAPLPDWIGPEEAKIAVLGWGSTRQIISEALRVLEDRHPGLAGTLAQIHLSWVQPLPIGLEAMLSRPEKTILVENNEGAHLGKLITMETGQRFMDPILRHDGLPFTVESLVRALEKRLAPVSPPPGGEQKPHHPHDKEMQNV